MTKPAFLIAARRTSVAPKNGVFKRVEVYDLAATVVTALLDETCIDPNQVDELILSNALYGGGNPARMTARAAGLPHSIAGLSTDRQCAGGLDAIGLARAMVQSGMAEVVIAGGAESASRRPNRARTDPDGGPASPYDRPPFAPNPMNDPDLHQASADLAHERGISALDQIAWTVESHAKALAARDRMLAEIVEVEDATRDTFTRALTPTLCKRAPLLSGGLSSATTAVSADAAAFVVVVSERIAQSHPNAVEIVEAATIGYDPRRPPLSPLPSIERVLNAANIQRDTLSTIEMMEAYAVQAMACLQDTGLDPEKTNLGGGALARGHPIGASGAVLAVRLFHELQARKGTGLAAIAAAGGVGSALVLRS
jgi:acetyl-CoA C-acetyltransferase